MKSRIVLVLFGVIWLTVVLAGLRAMAYYEATPGQAAAPASQWPATKLIQLRPDRNTLVIAAHPKCPCTRATIGELNALMLRCQGRLKVYVLFYKPRGAAAGWEKTDLWRSAAAIPGVEPITDENALESRRFDAETSGQTFLFNSAGQLLFNGGITSARGHAGDNAGSDAIADWTLTGKSVLSKTSVFGCSLNTPSQ